MRRLLLVLAGVVPMLALGLSGCSSDDEDAGGVDATLRDFKIELSASSAPAGAVTFKVKNQGPSVHEFVVFKTDLGVDELPTDDNGDVVENEDFEPLDEIEDIAVDATPSLEMDLDAGSYVILCNVPAHYRQGMVTTFSVT
ncbi:MAG: hypothetical protein WD691_09275 [Acidimicrobiales bacterium]